MALGWSRCRVQEGLALALLGFGCGDGCLCGDSSDDDEETTIACGVSSDDEDECGWLGCPGDPDPDSDSDPDPMPEPPPPDPDWEGCSLSAWQESDVLSLAGAVITSTNRIRIAAQARDELVWRAVSGLRRSLLVPAADPVDGTSTGGPDTDGSTGGGATGTGGTGGPATTSDSTGASTDTGGGTSTGGEDEPLPPEGAWTFTGDGYEYRAEPIVLDVAMVARAGLTFARPGDVLDQDLREIESYFNDYAFVAAEPPPWPDDVPLAGEMTFESLTPYAPLLGLDPLLESPHPIDREAFLDLSEALTAEAFLSLRRLDAAGVVEIGDVSGGVMTFVRAEANDTSLFDVLLGAAMPWTPTSYAAETAESNQRAVLQSGALWYRSAGYLDVPLPSEPSFETGTLYGDVVLKVQADGFDYDLTIEFPPDETQPDVTIRCY